MVVISLVGVLLVLHFAVANSYKLSAFDVRLDLALSTEPTTTINFPPIGKITAATHLTPVDLNIMLESIYQDRLTTIIEQVKNKEELISLLKDRVGNILRLFIIRLLILSGLGGMIGAVIVEQSHSALIRGVLIGILVIFCLVLGTYYTYDLTAFDDPNFTGMLEAAPWMIGLIQEGVNDIDQLGVEMELIASNMAQLFNKVDSLRPLSQVTGDLKVLHISDIHNNPIALRYVKQIIESFEVDLVIDTGDITDYGTPMEGKLLDQISNLGVAYIFIAGNHDSPAIIHKMENFENVTVLQSDIVETRGLVITGVADPAAESNQIKPLETEDMQQAKEELTRLVTTSDKKLDIVAVHQFDLGEEIVGQIPVVLHGHDHSFKVYEKNGTTVVDAGTTGAAGIRGFETKQGIPYSLALLHYNQSETENKLKVIDIIKFYSRHSGFMLERKLVGKKKAETEKSRKGEKVNE
ncbi:metallophosphoesterase family protein [Halanaerocella petrolearia]